MAKKQPRRLEDFEPLTVAERQVLDELDTGRLFDLRRETPYLHRLML